MLVIICTLAVLWQVPLPVAGRHMLLILQYHLCTLNDLHQTFLTSATSNKDEVFRFRDQRVKGQGHSMMKYLNSRQRYTKPATVC